MKLQVYLLENKNNFTSNCTVFARNLVLSKRLDSLFVVFLVNPRQGTYVFEYDDVTRPLNSSYASGITHAL